MPKGLKVALPGYNAETDTDPAHFSLYVDGTEDHILVKEKTRGSVSVNGTSTESINHALGYYPFTFAYVESSSGEFDMVYGGFGGQFTPYYSYVGTSNLLLGNQDPSSKNFFYVIFHDEL